MMEWCGMILQRWQGEHCEKKEGREVVKHEKMGRDGVIVDEMV